MSARVMAFPPSTTTDDAGLELARFRAKLSVDPADPDDLRHELHARAQEWLDEVLNQAEAYIRAAVEGHPDPEHFTDPEHFKLELGRACDGFMEIGRRVRYAAVRTIGNREARANYRKLRALLAAEKGRAS